MLDYYDALQTLLTELAPIDVEDRPLLEAVGLVLAEDVMVKHDAPLFDNSAMDGYALGGDVEDCQQWHIVDRIAAGASAADTVLATGQAARIFTGAPIPRGTTTVVLQENTQVENGVLKTSKPVKQGQNIRFQGEELAKGKCLLSAMQCLTPAMIAMLASQGYATVRVFKPLTICVFSTGNEVLEPCQPLVDGKIYDANRYLLLSWLKQSAHQITDGGILPDNQEKTEQALRKASQNFDVIITSGGVSVGEEDHVRAAIEQLGKLVFWKLAIKPGKPFAWGEINTTKIFMLPGNPVSSLVTFQQLVVPAIGKLAGKTIENAQPRSIQVKADFSISKLQSRREFLRVNLISSEEGFKAILLANQGSAMLSTCVKADALAEVPPETAVSQGDFIKVYRLDYKV